jgi:DNA polymerase III alpha subunit
MDFKSRAVNAENLEIWDEWRRRVWQNKQAGQNDLFGIGSEEPPPVLKDAEPWSRIKACQEEFEVFGFHFSGHPLEPWNPILKLVELKRKNDLFYGSELLKRKHLPKPCNKWRKRND